VNEALLDIEDYKTIYKFFPEHELNLQARRRPARPEYLPQCSTVPGVPITLR
jgi:hypothetical protein